MTHLTSKKGHVFARADRTAVYGHNLYLSDIDSTSNYVELTEEEGKELRAKLDEEAMKALR